jgi:putative hydrolase of the HAD superfamily
VIVASGRTVQQDAKIRRAGLDQLVRGWVISEAAGHTKPAPEIFVAAAAGVGASLTGGWVIGDSLHAGNAGAKALGLRRVWVTDGRPWTQASYQPTHVAAYVASAINHAISAAGEALRKTPARDG